MRALICTLSLAAGLALAAAGCGASKPAGKSGDGKAAATDPAKAVVYVEAIYGKDRKFSTGVIFDARKGYALTANHVVENAPAIEVTLNDGTLLHGRPVARAQCHDLAVLQLSPRPISEPAVAFANSSGVRLGDPVRTLSFSLPSASGSAPQLSSIQGSVASLNVRETFPPLPAFGPLIAHQTPLNAVASGSPLVNSRGQMIGLNTLVAHPRGEGALPGVEYALTSNYVRQRLSELKPGRGGALGGWQSEHDACHAALHKLIAKGHVGAH
jgi:S1-C subfamily serine protease